MKDQYNREINYMRLSITDRCNLRCRYCMPEGIEKDKAENIFSYEQILEVAEAAAGLGISRFKVTGGEPLVRKDCAQFIGSLKHLAGVEQVTLTTNGVFLAEKMPELCSAGLDAVNISLDTLDRERFRMITGRDLLPKVLKGMDAALSSPLPVKVNCVLQPEINADEWQNLAELAKVRRLDVRFIEMMPIGFGRQCASVSHTQLKKRFCEIYPEAQEDHRVHGNGPAVYLQVPGWKGSVGFISALHGKFCSRCNRLRLTAQGRLKPCLCYGEAEDLRAAFLHADRVERRRVLQEAIRNAVHHKPREHHFEQQDLITEALPMGRIGG